NSAVDDSQGVRMIEHAFERGVTLYDTANFEKDGKVEEWLGKAFRDRRDEGGIATKISGDATRKHNVVEGEKSPKRPQTEYIDLYQFDHWQPTVAIEESLEALTTLMRQGKILYAGCCWFKPYQIANSLRISERYGYTKLVSVGAKYNLLSQDIFSPYVL